MKSFWYFQHSCWNNILTFLNTNACKMGFLTLNCQCYLVTKYKMLNRLSKWRSTICLDVKSDSLGFALLQLSSNSLSIGPPLGSTKKPWQFFEKLQFQLVLIRLLMLDFKELQYICTAAEHFLNLRIDAWVFPISYPLNVACIQIINALAKNKNKN